MKRIKSIDKTFCRSFGSPFILSKIQIGLIVQKYHEHNFYLFQFKLQRNTVGLKVIDCFAEQRKERNFLTPFYRVTTKQIELKVTSPSLNRLTTLHPTK